MPRSSHTQALLGSEVYDRVKETPVLVVGAGGIGCELLKNLVMVGFGNIEIIDLDTIDLSNLNRQFLFRRPDVGRPKALVAAATARHFNPSSGINIHARHGNVKEPQNDFEWIKGFGLVMNALDNMAARRHVNRLCQAARVPLIESGTAGYLGQVTPIMNGKTECFDCVPKQTPKSFPVCTIRATPSEPIHCIVWAKSYLFGKLFGEDDEALDEQELDKAKESGENAEEIENLKKEAAAFREVRKALGEEDGPRRVFEKVFNDDINRLLSMEDMWKQPGRVKPTPLEYKGIMDETFEAPPLRSAASAPIANGGPSTNGGGPSGSAAANGHAQANGTANARQLKDQKELSLMENLELFVDSCRRLSARAISHPDVLLSFDKDDDDTLDFVLATANLRATAYGIANKTRFQVKEMAGNIIPAIATTNAIIAGMIVMQAVQMLGLTSPDHLRNTFTRQMPAKPLGMSLPAEPSKDCAVCNEIYIPLPVDVTRCTLGEFVLDIVGKWLGGAQEDEEELEWDVISEDHRLLADPDEVDNYGKTLEDLKIGRGQIVTIIDSEQKYRPVYFCILTATASYTLPESIPKLALRPPKPATPGPIEYTEEEVEVKVAEGVAPAVNGKSVGVKRPAPEDEEEEGAEAKKRKVLVMEEDDDDGFEIL